MQSGSAADEDWELLVSFFPKDWRDLALRSGALKGLRQDKSEEKLLRVLLLHVGVVCRCEKRWFGLGKAIWPTFRP